MTRSTQSAVGTVSAVLFFLASAVLLSRAGDDEPSADVLGRQVERSSTTTTELAAATTTSVTVTVPIVIEGTTTTSSITTSTTAPGATTTTATGSQPSGRSVERADRTSTFDYRPDGGGGMSTSDSAPPRDPFKFSALGSDVDHDGVAELRSEMANQTNREIAFPEGLVLRFVIKRDGQQWRTVELRFPDTQSLPAGGSLEIESATPLQQQYGHYEVTGEVTVDYR